MAEITVIVPVYKAESHLRRCVDSILAQTFSAFDLVLVDDGSPDQSPFICDDYASGDCRVHVIHQENGGPSIARNKGIEWAFSQSDSKYLTFVDSDDCVHPQFLEYMYYAIEGNVSAISMCRHRYIAAGEKLDKIEKYVACSAGEINAEDLMMTECAGFNYAWGKLYGKKCFQQIRFPDGISFGEDNLVIFKVMFACETLIFVDNELYFYFYTPTGITKSPWTPKSLDVFKGIRSQLDFYSEKGFQKAYEKELELYIQQYAYQIHRIREDKEHFRDNKAYLLEMKKQMKELLRENQIYKLSDYFFWYEALHPGRAAIRNAFRGVKRNLKENGMKGTLKKILGKILKKPGKPEKYEAES